jgi:hypothetical protein
MRKLRTILVASMVAASLYAAAGTAWARSDAGLRGTAWTDGAPPSAPELPDAGISWESFAFLFF